MPGGSTTAPSSSIAAVCWAWCRRCYLPNYREFYERRQFAPGERRRGDITLAGRTAPFGPDLLFAAGDLPGFVVHVEICEDLWVPIPPSGAAALAGATVLANLSGQQRSPSARPTAAACCASPPSARCLAAYLYAAAGAGESTTDLAWDGQASIFENGACWPRASASRRTASR